MELQIERRRVEAQENADPIGESFARFPFQSGVYETPFGEVGVRLTHRRDNETKVVLFSDALHTKNSEDRRIVKFSKDPESTVTQEVSPTEVLVFSRVE